MALLLKLTAEFVEIVYLAVEDDPNRFVFVVDWLVTSRQINDAEASHPQAGWPSSINALIVRTAMDDRLAHVPDIFSARSFSAHDQSRYTAHCSASIFSGLVP